MIKELNQKSLAFGVPGLLIQTLGLFINPFISIIGTVLLIIGLVYYAKSRGRSGYFGLFGILGILGLLVLVCLKDFSPTSTEAEISKKTKPRDVVLGIVLGLGLVIGVPLILFVLFNLFAK